MPGTPVAALGRALVVDDLADGRAMIGDRLAAVGFALSYAADGMDALGVFVRDEPDLVVTDWQMPRLNGIGLLRRIREISQVPVVIVTAFGSISACEEAMRVGADRYLEFRRDLDRLGSIARELVTQDARVEGQIGERSSPGRCPGAHERITAKAARSLAQRELRDQLGSQILDCRGNIAEVARRMGKDRATIRYHLRRFGMLDTD